MIVLLCYKMSRKSLGTRAFGLTACWKRAYFRSESIGLFLLAAQPKILDQRHTQAVKLQCEGHILGTIIARTNGLNLWNETGAV